MSKYYVLITFSLFVVFITNFTSEVEKRPLDIKNFEGEINIPKSILMYESIEKYSEIYDVPKYIAYNVAYMETKYKGPFHFNYNPEQGSSAGALGPMQIMPGTANSKVFTDTTITHNDLLSNIDMNIELSMKILRGAYDSHKNWAIACGKYNTGKAIVNDYAVYCSSNKSYTKNWVKPR